MQKKLNMLRKKLADERGNTVVLVSHCALNENARYLGGAFHGAAVPGILETALRDGHGIVQMPCPEQRAWGGILKKYMWLSLGMRRTPLFALRGVIVPLFILHTRIVYRRIARRIARDICDYRDSGFRVIGILGMDGSPSCGVNSRLDMKKTFRFFSSLDPVMLDRRSMNERMYGTCLVNGRGLFMAEVEKILARKGITIEFLAHDLLEEMNETKVQGANPDTGPA